MITFLASTIILLVSILFANAALKFRKSKTYTDTLAKNKALGLIANAVSGSVFLFNYFFALLSVMIVVSFGYFVAEDAVINLISNAPVLWIYVAIAIIVVLIALMVGVFFLNKKYKRAEGFNVNAIVLYFVYLGFELGSFMLIVKILLLFTVNF